MRMKMKMAAAALGMALVSVVGAANAVEPGYYPADDYGNCSAGAFSVNDYDSNVYAAYSFAAMRNGESSNGYGAVYNSIGQIIFNDIATFSCIDGYVYYSGRYVDGPSWD